MRTEENTLTVKQQVSLWLDSWLVVGLSLLSWFVILLCGRGYTWLGMAVGVMAMAAALNKEKVALAMAVAMLWVFKAMQAAGWRRMEAGPEKFAWMIGAIVVGATVVGGVGWLVSWWRERSKTKDW